MRQIVLDTETTGLSTADGHRIIEIGCIELVNRRITGRDYHRFLWRENPGDPVRIYRWISHVFGNAGSPCVAISTVKTHAGVRRLQFPLAADALIHSTLVDDSLVSISPMRTLPSNCTASFSSVRGSDTNTPGSTPTDFAAPRKSTIICSVGDRGSVT